MRLRRLAAARDGAVAVEVALVSSLILVPLLLGLWDVAQIAFAKAKVDEALQDAVSYVAAGNSGNSSGITSAAQGAYGNTISVSTSTACYCVKTTTSTPTAPSSVSCSGSCAGGSTLQQFMSITVSLAVSIPFTVTYLGSSVTVSSTGQVRTG